MKKRFKLENLDCANCAAKMETAIGKLSGVNHAEVSFMAQKLTLDAEDERFEEILDAAQAAIRKVDRDCTIVR